MTHDAQRKPTQVNKANLRANNIHGHIIKLIEKGGEHTATRFRWDIFIGSGDPNNPEHQAYYQGHRDVSWFPSPGNLVFDDQGRLWVATDGQPSSIQENDAAYMVETEGPQRGKVSMFLCGQWVPN